MRAVQPRDLSASPPAHPIRHRRRKQTLTSIAPRSFRRGGDTYESRPGARTVIMLYCARRRKWEGDAGNPAGDGRLSPRLAADGGDKPRHPPPVSTRQHSHDTEDNERQIPALQEAPAPQLLRSPRSSSTLSAILSRMVGASGHCSLHAGSRPAESFPPVAAAVDSSLRRVVTGGGSWRAVSPRHPQPRSIAHDSGRRKPSLRATPSV